MKKLLKKVHEKRFEKRFEVRKFFVRTDRTQGLSEQFGRQFGEPTCRSWQINTETKISSKARLKIHTLYIF